MNRTKSMYLAFIAVLLSPMVANADPIVVTDASQLDFSGDFVYALNFNGTGTQTVGDATFTNVGSNGAGAPSGATINGFDRNAVWGGGADLGVGADNDALENILKTIVWSLGYGNGSLDLLVDAGQEYRLQLLYSEGCCNTRAYNVDVGGIFSDEILGVAVGGSIWRPSRAQGYAHQVDFTASGGSFSIDFGRLDFGDTNYHISGLTLERVPEPGTLALLGLGLAGMGMTRRKKKI